MSKSCGYDVRQITRVESLYTSDPEEYLNVLCRLPDDLKVVLVVGHNPGMEEYLTVLTGQPEEMPALLGVTGAGQAVWGLECGLISSNYPLKYARLYLTF